MRNRIIVYQELNIVFHIFFQIRKVLFMNMTSFLESNYFRNDFPDKFLSIATIPNKFVFLQCHILKNTISD